MRTGRWIIFALLMVVNLLILLVFAHIYPSVAQEQSSNVELIGQVGGPTYAVTVEGSYAYIGVGRRLVIVNISNPEHTFTVGQSPILPVRDIQDVAVAGNYAYVAGRGNMELQIIDVTNLASPTEIGSYGTSGYAFGVAVIGNYAYVASGDMDCESST